MNFNANYNKLQFQKQFITKEMFTKIRNTYRKDDKYKVKESEKENIKAKYNITSEQLNTILGLKKTYTEPKSEIKNALLIIAGSDENDNLRKTSPLTDENLPKTIKFIKNRMLQDTSIDLTDVVNNIIKEQNIHSLKKQALLHSICSKACIEAAESIDNKEDKILLLKNAYSANYSIDEIIASDTKNEYYTQERMINNYIFLLKIAQQLVENNYSSFLEKCESLVSFCDYVLSIIGPNEKNGILGLKDYFMNKAEEYNRSMLANNNKLCRRNKQFYPEPIANYFPVLETQELNPLSPPLMYEIPEDTNVTGKDRILMMACDLINTGYPINEENLIYIVDELLEDPKIDFHNMVEKYIKKYNITSPIAQVALFNICRYSCWNAATEITENNENKIAFLFNAYQSICEVCSILEDDENNNKQFSKVSMWNSCNDLFYLAQELVENNYYDIFSKCEIIAEICDKALSYTDNPDEKYEVLLQKVYFLKAAKNYDKAIETLISIKTSFPEKIQELDSKIKAIEALNPKPVREENDKNNSVYFIDDVDKAIMEHIEEMEKQTTNSALPYENSLSCAADALNNTLEIFNEPFLPQSKKDIQPIFDENTPDTITLKAIKRYRFEKDLTIDIPNTNKAKTLYTQTQYILPDILKFKPLGVRSLSKAIAGNQIIPDSLICLNNSKEKPLYAMELTGKVVENLAEPDSSKGGFSIRKIFGQKRMIYTEKNIYGKMRHFIVLDRDISEQYAHNNMTDKIIQNSQTIIEPMQHFESEKYFITDSETVKSNLFLTRSIFNGSILGDDVKNALDVLNLPVDQLYEIDIAGNLYYKDENNNKVHTGISLSKYPQLVTLSLINYNCNEGGDDSGKNTLKKIINEVNNNDTSEDRARFFFENGNCYFTTNKSELSRDRQFTIKDMKTLYNK